MFGWVFSRGDLELLNEAMGDFSIRLLKQFLEEGKESIVYSAHSIFTALGMSMIGARGETYVEMRDTLGLGAVNEEQIERGFKDSRDELRTVTQESKTIDGASIGLTLAQANRLYVGVEHRISEGFVERTRNIFDADAVSVDFLVNQKEVMDMINSFVSEKTRGLIPRIIENVIDKDTAMVLVNALYFKGVWRNTKNPRPSRERFNANINGPGEEAEWIGLEEDLRYSSSEKLDAQLIGVPFTYFPSLDVSILFILPNESYKHEFERWLSSEKLTWANISEAIHSMKEMYADLTFPKFEVKSNRSLVETLRHMGMVTPFKPSADFTRTFLEPCVSLTDVLHGATLKVDEFGCEAAACTVVMEGPLCLHCPEVHVNVNRSFIAMIVHRQKECSVPLFTAVVNKLTANK